MLRLPGSADEFLARNWQKTPLFIPGALDRLRPRVTRNELGWLATLDDVESRIVFTECSGTQTRYRAETGPFDPEYLAALPKRGWTLLVHDVEKHLPVMRRLFAHVPFVPDWRIDDLMVSFAAPGGGVGPHTDNYDVFLCQGIGVREWRITGEPVPDDARASDDLALKKPFGGDVHVAREGDVLYLPPGVVHWGTAKRACITYSIGMRAPQLSDLGGALPDTQGDNPFYEDPDITASEARPGYISSQAIARATGLARTPARPQEVAEALGRYVSETKAWLRPDGATPDEVRRCLRDQLRLTVHGMARIAWDDCNVYVNGRCRPLQSGEAAVVEEICRTRELRRSASAFESTRELVGWLLETGAFEIPGNS
jgi:50S ribosomal protein L16 3-hydroxylase